ncbi:MAG: serine/threonine protein kinase, partial [Bradymonadia bacterium]
MQFPQRFGKYTLLKHIATGGMADIYLANMKSGLGFEKEVVIKRLRPEHAANPELVGMFLDEARTAANLTHPNIAQIFDLGEFDGDYFIAMEYVRGVDLLRICSHGIEANNYLPLHHAVRIMANVCDALAYAHDECTAGGVALKVVHRDVSPTNILISYDGACKLIDFGIAKAKTQATLTKVGQIKGKFGYMAPEQCRGEPVDARTDIFAVGINLYEITLGRRLFKGASEVETIEKIEDAIVTPPIEVNARFPEMLSRIVMRSLAREPEERYQDARQMQIALEEFLVSAGLRSTKGMMGAYIRRLFRAQIADENAVLGALRVQARSMPPSAAPPPVDDDAEDDVDQTVRVAWSTAAPAAEPTVLTSSPAVMQSTGEQSTGEQSTGEQSTGEQSVAQARAHPVTQPAEQAMTQPAVQPMTQPAVQPMTQPAVQPMTQPAVQPMTQPAVQPMT